MDKIGSGNLQKLAKDMAVQTEKVNESAMNNISIFVEMFFFSSFNRRAHAGRDFHSLNAGKLGTKTYSKFPDVFICRRRIII